MATEAIATGKYLGPLHGIPFALKDLYETKGVVTTAGSRLRSDYVPMEDAHAVTLLRQAGAVFLGKLTLHELAFGGTNINPYYPSSRNPWNLEHISGGSSGGSAAAVSAGLCIGSIASDTRGSIRIPSALCGVTGLKPTYGRVSLRGVVPLNWSLDHAGPIARTASDCAIILQAVARYDDKDPTSVDAPVMDYSAELDKPISRIRIGVPTNFFFDSDAVEPEVDAAVRRAAEVFASLGALIKDVVVPGVEQFGINDAFVADAASHYERDLEERPEAFSDVTRSRLQNGASIRAVDYSRARYQQLELKRTFQRLFHDIDLLLTPTVPIVAPHAAEAEPLSPVVARNTLAYDVAGIPAISIPCGFNSGLPIGLSLAGPAWQEALVLRTAHAYQTVTDWHKRRPPIAA
jgi:aspartyl-tRNA(Asn)/glutamyl-tRNA(Gln) amidotransferase subunit A